MIGTLSTERLVCVETDGLGDLIVNPYRQTDDMARSTRLVILVKNSAFIRTDRQKDIARSTRLVMLIKNILDSSSDADQEYICFVGSETSTSD